jgi:hypothetical protein
LSHLFPEQSAKGLSHRRHIHGNEKNHHSEIVSAPSLALAIETNKEHVGESRWVMLMEGAARMDAGRTFSF